MFISKFIQNNATHNVTTATNDETAKKTAHSSLVLGNVENIENAPQALIGKTINPRYVTKTLNKVSYDGHGKILSFKKTLTAKEYDKLAANVIPDLVHTPAHAETAIRTPLECLVKIATIINKSTLSDPTKQEILSDIKDTFLAGNIKHSTIKDLFDSFKYEIPSKSLMKELTTAIRSLEREFYITKHNDNYYGRTFDTELAKYIVDSPSDKAIKSCEIIKSTIIESVSKMTSADRVKFCDDIRKRLREDPATWRADIQEVKDFMETNDTANFFRMLNTDAEAKYLLIMQLTVKFLLATPDFRELAAISDRTYNKVIIPQRKNEKTLNPDLIKSSRTGIQLPYQIRSQEAKEPTGERPIDRYQPLVSEITKHNSQALLAEHPIAVGMSGSANFLNHFFGALEEKNSDFDMDHARLFAAAYLTHSGGHSFNEAYTVYNYKETQSFKPMTYNSIANQNDYASDAVNAAYDKLLATAMEL